MCSFLVAVPTLDSRAGWKSTSFMDQDTVVFLVGHFGVTHQIQPSLFPLNAPSGVPSLFKAVLELTKKTEVGQAGRRN